MAVFHNLSLLTLVLSSLLSGVVVVFLLISPLDLHQCSLGSSWISVPLYSLCESSQILVPFLSMQVNLSPFFSVVGQSISFLFLTCAPSFCLTSQISILDSFLISLLIAQSQIPFDFHFSLLSHISSSFSSFSVISFSLLQENDNKISSFSLDLPCHPHTLSISNWTRYSHDKVLIKPEAYTKISILYQVLIQQNQYNSIKHSMKFTS